MSKLPFVKFYVSDFLGSPTVGLMDAAEVGGYFLLICMAWQSERPGYLPDNDQMLRRWARFSREAWDGSRDLILSKFPVTEPGWRSNERMVAEAGKAAAFSESQSRKGSRGGRPKKKPGLSEKKPGVISEKPGLHPIKPTIAIAIANTSSPLRGGEKRSSPSKRKGGEPDLRHAPCREAVEEYMKAYGCPYQWGAGEGAQLAALLRDSPFITLEQFATAVGNRAATPGIVHGDRPRKWLGDVLRYLRNPLDRFGKNPEDPKRSVDRPASVLVDPQSIYDGPEYKRAVNQ